MDIGVYCVHPLVRLFGMPEKSNRRRPPGNGIDGSGTILGVYKDMQAELVYSKISSSRIPSQIQGENGTITIEGIDHPHQLIFMTEPAADRSCTRVLPRRTCPVR